MSALTFLFTYNFSERFKNVHTEMQPQENVWERLFQLKPFMSFNDYLSRL